jgi:hypothetical protein
MMASILSLVIRCFRLKQNKETVVSKEASNNLEKLPARRWSFGVQTRSQLPEKRTSSTTLNSIDSKETKDSQGSNLAKVPSSLSPAAQTSKASSHSNHLHSPSHIRDARIYEIGDNDEAVTNENAQMRFVLDTGTAKWALGKTVHQGSTSKVILGTNLATGEQVLCIIVVIHQKIPSDLFDSS